MHADLTAAWAILALALLLDGTVGEYPAVLHPVVWIGHSIAAGLRLAPASGWWRQFIFGALLTLLIAAGSAGLTCLLLWSVASYPLFAILVGAILLKASFALRELGRAAKGVLRALDEGNLPKARRALASLCSRDARALSPEELLAATIESLAENISDSFVAPLFYYVLLSVPGAVAYRAINTLDAMIGYHGKFEALGKFSARLDDLANLIPARLTASLFLMIGWFGGGNGVQGWRILCRDGANTPSPNGGRPMSVMAGLLDVQLTKKGVYSLGEAREPLTPAKVRQAWRIVLAASGIMVISGCLALLAMVGA
ncbi:MAG TPA: adenosylcobinamide-phosphate synthase CbiB [Gemmataceae bacterium]|jgi:adenosylcobinamide-phosphate synthase|nr:adenosylcobinamide-phosphate synthase CbiB [Gemmataceae bacterium]